MKSIDNFTKFVWVRDFRSKVWLNADSMRLGLMSVLGLKRGFRGKSKVKVQDRGKVVQNWSSNLAASLKLCLLHFLVNLEGRYPPALQDRSIFC